jgi:hypothetical protein
VSRLRGFVEAAVLGLVCGVIVSAAVSVARAAMQERQDDYPQTRTWVALDQGQTSSPLYRPLRVRVIDTAGVCLYVAQGYANDDVAISAVPKTQLPKGAGCQ